MSKSILKTVKNITIGAVLGATISTGILLTLNGNLGVARVIEPCEDNCVENGFDYYCDTTTYDKACSEYDIKDNTLVVPMKNRNVGDKIVFFRHNHRWIHPDFQFKLF